MTCIIVSDCLYVNYYWTLYPMVKFILCAHVAAGDGQDCKPEALGRSPCHTSTVRTTLTLVPGGFALLGVCVTLLMDLRTSMCVAQLEEPLITHEDSASKESMYSWKTIRLDAKERPLKRKRFGCSLFGRRCCIGQNVSAWLY